MPLSDISYRYVFLVQNRDYWENCPYQYDKNLDLVLTFDFGVVRELTLQGGSAEFLDHFVESDRMEFYNYETYQFFNKWHYTCNGNDHFYYNGIAFGNAFRIEIWNDITYLVRIFLNLLKLKKINFKKLYAGIEDRVVLDVLELLNFKKMTWDFEGTQKYPEYYFPVFRWMNERIRPSGLKTVLKLALSKALDIFFSNS